MQKLKMFFVAMILFTGAIATAKADEGSITIIETWPTDTLALSEEFEEGEINNTDLVEFLTQKIIPYFKRAGNKGEHRIYIYFRDIEEGDIEEGEICGEYVTIIAETNCEYCYYKDCLLNDPKEHNTTYVSRIDNVIILLVDETQDLSSMFIKPLGKKHKMNSLYWKKNPSIRGPIVREPAAWWELIATKDQIHRVWFYPVADLFWKWKEDQQKDHVPMK